MNTQAAHLRVLQKSKKGGVVIQNRDMTSDEVLRMIVAISEKGRFDIEYLAESDLYRVVVSNMREDRANISELDKDPVMAIRKAASSLSARMERGIEREWFRIKSIMSVIEIAERKKEAFDKHMWGS